jgi:hypothetical protein
MTAVADGILELERAFDDAELHGDAGRLGALNAALASSGRLPARHLPTPAWIVITARACATTSCISRAIRTRSSRTSAARSRSACEASPAW